MNSSIRNILQKGSAEQAHMADQQEMLALFHQPERELELKSELVKALEQMDVPSDSVPNIYKLFIRVWNRIELQEHQRILRQRYLNITARIAAAVIIGLFAGVSLYHLFSRPESAHFTAHSPYGSVSEWLLPDGTRIMLNSGSEVRYVLNGKGKPREVFLRGEAWFQVQKDARRPFVVHTPFYDVRVTGTSFNVKAYPEENRVVTTLEEGKVLIQSDSHKILASGIALNPGQQMILEGARGTPRLREVNTRWYTAWKDNKMILVNMPLKDLVILLERKYGVDLVVKDETVLDYHCDGSFQGESILEVMEILKKTIGIDYQVVGQSIEITKHKTRKKGGHIP